MSIIKIPLTTVAARLEKAIHADVGERGLNTLIYGWRMHPRFHSVPVNVLCKRVFSDGFQWLSMSELESLSKYAQYDLTHD